MKINLNKYIFPYNGTIFDALYKIKINKIKTLFVLKNHKVIGVLDIEDIVVAFLNGTNVYSSIDSIYNKSFKYLTCRSLKKAKELFERFNLTAIPILNKKHHLNDLITIKDILKL